MTWQEIIRQLDVPLIQALVERGYYLGTEEVKLDAVYLNDLYITEEIIYQLKLFIASVQMSTLCQYFHKENKRKINKK